MTMGIAGDRLVRMVRAALLALAGLCALAGMPAMAQQSACADSIRGKVAWDGKANTNWSSANLERLCRGAENSTEPGACFNRVMTSGSVDWGGGSVWKPDNALRLCAGATDAQQRIACFQAKLGTMAWNRAVDECAKPQPQAASGAPERAVPTARAPSAATSETAEQAKKFAKGFTCKGPLELEYLTDPTGSAGQHQFVVNFVGADGPANLRPGTCWRSGGWGFPLSLGAQGQGRLLFTFPLGSCPLFQSMRVSGGKVTEFTMTVQGRGGMYAAMLYDAAIKPGTTLQVDVRHLFGPNVATPGSTYELVAPEGDIFRPERCK